MCFLIPGQRKSPGGRLLLVRFDPEQVGLARKSIIAIVYVCGPKGKHPGLYTERTGSAISRPNRVPDASLDALNAPPHTAPILELNRELWWSRPKQTHLQ